MNLKSVFSNMAKGLMGDKDTKEPDSDGDAYDWMTDEVKEAVKSNPKAAQLATRIDSTKLTAAQKLQRMQQWLKTNGALNG